MSTSPLCFDPYVIHNLIGNRILDVGCGYGKWGFLIKKYLDHPYVVGIDAFEPHTHSARQLNVYDELLSASAIALPFADKSFDSAVACEIIEHLPREHGPLLIQELRRVCRSCFVVSTPNFDCLRDGHMTLDGFNPHEAHKYIYSYDNFRSLGFTQIIGLGNMQLPKYRLGVAASSLGLFFPSRSAYLMGFWFGDGKKRLVYAV